MGTVAETGASGSLNHHGRWCWVLFERIEAIEKVADCFSNGQQVSEGVWFVFELVVVRTTMGGSVGGGTGQWLLNSHGRWHWASFGGGCLFKRW